MSSVSCTNWLCFRDAHWEKKMQRISDEEYYHHLLKHLTGETHENEHCTADDRGLANTDPFGYEVQRVSREIDHSQDLATFERVFEAYRTGSLEDVIAEHDSFDEKYTKHIRRLLAMRSLRDRRADILRFCLKLAGFEYDFAFKWEANLVTKDDHPKTFEALEESPFRKVHPRSLPPWEMFDNGGPFAVDW
ncbi:hypothetical protein GL218_04554 [Daldinia childiae]|uniref:uncharacterized protein n=1 Tax=Daldinia childiae TaxID=326645 RepID=UPI0014483F21|nr:uncharacterized protein GL218_04554 [Daldinia childiae]KAF3059922.1 hypothetical protein GL218_04554 [Daldinia childiae]